MKSPSNRQTHKNTDTPLPSPVLFNRYKESRKNTKKITITHSYNRIIATKQKKTATLRNRATPRALAAWGIPRLIQTREKKHKKQTYNSSNKMCAEEKENLLT